MIDNLVKDCTMIDHVKMVMSLAALHIAAYFVLINLYEMIN